MLSQALEQARPDTQDAAVDTTVDQLGEQVLHMIFSQLSGKDCGRAACASSSWRVLLSDELLWRDMCMREWGLDTPLLPDGTTSALFRVAYGSWQRGFHGYGALAPRARRVWSTIRGWMAQNINPISESLRPGASEEELNDAEAQLGFPLPAALRVLYRFTNGQDLEMDKQLDAAHQAPVHESMLHGLIGSYTFYDHIVSTRLLPLARMIRWTKMAQDHLSNQLTNRSDVPRVLFAASFNFNKVLLCDTESAQVQAWLADKVTVIDAVPQQPERKDGVLRWLEEFAARVAAGRYRPDNIEDAGVRPTKALSLFECTQPVATEAVTCGVRVSASPLFVPEHSHGAVGDENHPQDPRYFFAYSIRMQLLSEVEQKAVGVQKPIKRCQLRARHWKLRNSADEVVEDIQGDGVVGCFPILDAGREEYVYQSCTNQSEPQGSMEGSFTFAEGKIAKPTGPDFDVTCPRFELQVPEYVF